MTIKNQDDVRLLKSPKEVWADALPLLLKKVPRPTFESWLKHAQLVALEKNEATIGVTNDVFRSMLVPYKKAITDALSEVTRLPIVVTIAVDAAVKVKVDNSAAGLASISILPSDDGSQGHPANPSVGAGFAGPSPVGMSGKPNVNPRYNFSTFVVGSHNRFAHSAAVSVAAKPAETYNPLFLYGGVGLGKTHLMHAIGNELQKNAPHLSVRYISCERFTNDFINSIKDNCMSEFRKRYRQVDVLLVDDIQFIQGKESSQEEFFHTFNALRDNGRQLVVTSDRPPKAITAIEERLRSRLEWGLVADIQAPDLETRLAILRKKCDVDGIKFSNDVLEYIATTFTTNIRELEGALIRTNAYAGLSGGELSAASLRAILQPVGVEKPKKTITIDYIIDLVAAHYRIESSEIRSTKRSQDLALPRHVAMYLAHEIIQMSFPRIGAAFSNRKHTSALYAHSRIKEGILKDPNLAHAVKQLTDRLAV